jgi:hypothetical protein
MTSKSHPKDVESSLTQQGGESTRRLKALKVVPAESERVMR